MMGAVSSPTGDDLIKAGVKDHIAMQKLDINTDVSSSTCYPQVDGHINRAGSATDGTFALTGTQADPPNTNDNDATGSVFEDGVDNLMKPVPDTLAVDEEDGGNPDLEIVLPDGEDATAKTVGDDIKAADYQTEVSQKKKKKRKPKSQRGLVCSRSAYEVFQVNLTRWAIEESYWF